MKKAIALTFILLLVVSTFSACLLPDNPGLKSLGRYQKRAYYQSEGFQDFTAYAKYYYDGVDFSKNDVYSKVTPADIASINHILDDFDQWVDMYKEYNGSSELVNNYDFNRAIMDCEDYLYMESETYIWDDGQKGYYSYNVYLYDSQTDILYYFHNNI